MSFKKRFFNLFMAIVAVAGMLPTVALNAYAETTLPEPKSGKYMFSNGDGTYDITLSVTGEAAQNQQNTKANVVVVLDTSGSMAYCTGTGASPSGRTCSTSEGGQTRLEAAKENTKKLAETLTNLNTTSGVTDMVEMVFINFSTTASTPSSVITAYSGTNGAESWINKQTANGGTNWEDALNKAKDVSFSDTDKTYIIFISDGDPTYRMTSHSGERCADWRGGRCRDWETTTDPDEYYYSNGWWDWRQNSSGTHGTGSGDYYGWNFSNAQAVASTIDADSNKVLYSVAIYGDAEKMSGLGGNFIDAKTTSAMSEALSGIASQITNNLSLSQVSFTDGLTSETEIAVNGAVGDFVYRKGVWDGNKDTLKNLPEWDIAEDGVSPASFSGGSVKWDLGNYALSNNETATVTFTVWPSQDAYDTVAKLNNGVLNYDDLTDTVKESIIKTNDGYALRTNTTASLKYCVKTVSSAGADSEVCPETPTIIDNPEETIPLSGATLSLLKIWQDTIAGEDRGTSVELKLKKDGREYVKVKEGDELVETFSFTPETYTATTADVDGKNYDAWKYNYQISIAPGVMISKNSKSYAGIDSLGKYTEVGDYLILDEGHDYEIEEVDLDRHYELNNNVYHPMFVDGTLYNVLFEKNNSGTITGISKMEEMNYVAATNTVKSGINISKQVIDKDNKVLAVNDKFDINVSLTKDGEPYDYDYRVLTYATPEHIGEATSVSAHYCSNTNVSSSCKAENTTGVSGTIQETISIYDVIRIVNVEAGVSFDITEDSLGLGYTLDDINYPDADHIVKGDTVYDVVVKNKYSYGDLEVSKTVTVKSGSSEKIADKEFSFELTLTDGSDRPLSGEYVYKINGASQNETVSNGKTLSLKDGDSVVLEKLPEGAKATLKETNLPNGFTAENDEQSVTITSGENKLTFKNVYEAKGTATLTANKLFGSLDGPTFWNITDEFTFILKDGAGKEIARATTDASHVATFTIDVEDEGDFVYEISEDESAFANQPYIIRKTGDENITVSFTAEDKDGEGVLTISGLSYSKTDKTIYNSYVSTGKLEGALEFTKVLENREWLDTDVFTFTLTSTDENAPLPETTTAEATKNSQTFDFGDIDFSEIDLPEEGIEYHYIITEEASDMPDMEFAEPIEITVYVRHGQNPGELEIATNGYSLEFVNTYVGGKGSVEENPVTYDRGIALYVVLFMLALFGLAFSLKNGKIFLHEQQETNPISSPSIFAGKMLGRRVAKDSLSYARRSRGRSESRPARLQRPRSLGL